ncbi:MAG: polysaccharide biosynthesis tyrosine autokinase [Ferruginibacter sp.]
MKSANESYGEIVERHESNSLEQLIAKFLPYWPLLLLFVFLSVGGAYVYLRYTTPMYAAFASVLIKDDRKNTNSSESLQSAGFFESRKNLENEIRVLQSRALMEDVVKRLALYAPLSQKGKVKVGDAYEISPVIVEAKNPDSIKEVKEVNFLYNKTDSTIILDGKDKFPINQLVNTNYGVLRFLSNPNYIPTFESDKKLYFSFYKPSKVAVELLKDFIVTGGSSSLVDLSYKDAIPQRAINILNNLVDIYEKESIQDKNNLSKNALAFINEQLAIIGQDLDSIEKKIQNYRSGSNAISMSEQSSVLIQGAAAVDQKMGELNNQAAVLDQIEKYATSKANENQGTALVPSAFGITDPTLTTLTSQLFTQQQEYDKLKKIVGEKNPKLLAIEEQINKLKPEILNNIRTQQSSIETSKRSLNTTGSNFNSKLLTVPAKERALVDISRQQQQKNNLYQLLLQKKQEAELTLASISSSSKVIDTALAGKDPVSPKKKLIYLLALVFGGCLFVGVILIKDLFNGKIMYRNEIEKMTFIPVIGEISYEKTDSPLVIAKGTRSFIAEAFRKLRISLSFLGVDATHKKILITSSISGEGKSFVASNLAISLSLTGKKVVLVDLDLNNPTQSKNLSVNFDNGVTEYLTGEKTPVEIINKIETQENLYFISAGSLPENPTELLANGKIKLLIDYLDNEFDVVVIDTSPSALVTDAFILSEFCDATLFVIRHNYTPKRLINRIDESNQINAITNPAIVFNGLKTRGVFKNNYGYGYDYVYGNKDRGGKSKKVY